jgi:anti-anti-sigma factor
MDDRRMLLLSILYQVVRCLLGLAAVRVRRDLSKDAEAMTLRPCDLVVDLSEVTFLGSIGLQILVELNDSQHDVGRHPALVVADQRAAGRPLEITGLDEVLDVHHDLQSAVGACHATSQVGALGPAMGVPGSR